MSDDEQRKDPEPPSQLEVPAWMVTYGDMTSLLLCFFVLLFIFSKSDVEKYKSAIGSIQEAFGVQNKRPESPFHAYSPTPDEHKDIDMSKNESDLYTTMQEAVNDVIVSEPELKQSLRVETTETGVALVIYNHELFKPGTAILTANASELLQPVVEAANRYNFNILVKSNVTRNSLDTQYFSSIWEFSGARAGAALNGLLDLGVKPATRLKSMGMGDTAPRMFDDLRKSEIENNRTEFLFHMPGKEFW